MGWISLYCEQQTGLSFQKFGPWIKENLLKSNPHYFQPVEAIATSVHSSYCREFLNGALSSRTLIWTFPLFMSDSTTRTMNGQTLTRRKSNAGQKVSGRRSSGIYPGGSSILKATTQDLKERLGFEVLVGG